MPIRLLFLLPLLAACNAPATAPAEAPLELNIDRERITVSGISSGAYMAGQLHVAHSSLIGGAALLAGGPYACAGGSIQQALSLCTKGGDFDLDAIAERVSSLAESGAIDDPSNLADDRVWLFHGAADAVVDASVPAAAADFYRRYVPPENIALIDTVPAVHGMPTVSAGAPCGEMASPFINACGFDAAGALLEYLYGPLDEPAATTGELRTLDQHAFADAELWGHAFLYVPEACAAGAACGLHVAFHGCRQSAEFVGDAFAKDAGYNRWAETNRLVVLYPQVASSKVAPLNPHGCWDWWGYTGEQYATKQGAQVSAVVSLIDALMQ
ncbi:MAG TPA: PHB depolymerase family esterase [Woeseiaceae bacterium]|nr:PHB depolymerase family esterase [Woeseiaceae bacterium]